MSTQSLQRSTAQAEGIDPQAISSFLTAADETNAGLHSFMIVRHRVVAAEGWWSPYSSDLQHMMFSISKSFTATAIGIAEDAGLLSVDEPILSFFPGQSSARVRAAASGVRVRDLLSMSTGHAMDTFPIMRALPHEDWVRLFFDVPFVYPPGTHFLYNTGASYVLAAALRARTGQSLLGYLTPRLFEPLGIERPSWHAGPAGIELGGTGLRVTTEDIAKLGLLYLNRGLWNDTRLLSEKWVAKASSKQVDNENDAPDWAAGYGFQFWRSRDDSYRADGAFGQFSFVFPEHDAVVAITAGVKENWRIPNLVWDHLLPGFNADTADAAVSASALAEQVRALAIQAPAIAPLSASALTERRMSMSFNTLGLTAATVTGDGERAQLVLEHASGAQHTIKGDARSWTAGESTLWADDELRRTPTAARAGATADGAIEFHEQCVETVFKRVWRFETTGLASAKLTIQLTVAGSVESTETIQLVFD